MLMEAHDRKAKQDLEELDREDEVERQTGVSVDDGSGTVMADETLDDTVDLSSADLDFSAYLASLSDASLVPATRAGTPR